jgi:hypothetical protein
MLDKSHLLFEVINGGLVAQQTLILMLGDGRILTLC